MSAIDHFNLAAVDLNLLVVFDALIDELHVTRAARKIGLSQPATSNALARLRLLFKDELFIKTSGGITPTPKAIELAESVRQVLQQIQTTLSSEPAFFPATSERTFRLGMDDYTELVFLPNLIQHLERVAPKVKLQVRSTNWQRSPKLLDADEVDLTIGHCPQWQTWHQQRCLFEEQFVCVASQNHSTIGNTLPLKDYLSASHLLVSPREDMTGLVDSLLAKQNHKRHITISVPHFLVVPSVLADTNLIATLPERLAKACASISELSILPLPLEVPGFSVDLLWHQKNSNEPGHVWFRQIISELCQD